MTDANHRELLGQADVMLLIVELLAPPGTVDGMLSAAVTLGPGFFERACLEGAVPLAALTRSLAYHAEDPAAAWEHTRLFEGAIACPITETAYIRRSKGAILADVAAFHRAFGLALDPAAHEKADHLGAELELLAMLLVMEHLATVDGDEERRAITTAAIRAFAMDHLNEWIHGFTARLGATAAHPFHAALAAFIDAVWDAFAARRALPRPDALVTPVEDEGTPYECDMADAAPRHETRSDAR